MKYNNEKTYNLKLAGLTREIPIVKIGENLWIASFVMLGDTELNYRCAREIVRRFPEDFDYVITPEAKAIPLAQSICQLCEMDGKFKDYLVLRKSVKGYMKNPIIVEVKSITTTSKQIMVLEERAVEKIKGKRVCLIDDVISTGGSYRAMIELVKKAGADIVFAGAVLREGDFDISDIENSVGRISYLENLPVFN